jgi:hypothetical protein
VEEAKYLRAEIERLQGGIHLAIEILHPSESCYGTEARDVLYAVLRGCPPNCNTPTAHAADNCPSRPVVINIRPDDAPSAS